MAGKKKKRRVRSPHPGVVLIPPETSGRHPYWRARYRDADSGRMTKVRLNPVELPSEEARREWAKRKSKALAKRQMELEEGAPRATGSELKDVIDRYYDAHPQLRERTLTAYRGATDKLLAWAKKAGITKADDVTRAGLLEFKKRAIAERRHGRVPGGKRGEVAPTSKPRSAYSVNRELRGVRTVLGYLRDLDLLPRLTHDDLRRALKRLPVASERIEYLKPNECRQLLEAALLHDAETFAETRDEHTGEGRRRIGTTPRYEPIAPFAAYVLLTGCRLAEALALEWRQVDLDALDHDGRPVGEIHLAGAATKTHKARTIGLEVSPALRDLLIAIRPERAKGNVFGLSRGTAEAAGKRLRAEYGAPGPFSWQALRRSCGTYLTNASGIFGAASAYRSAKQLGHSVQVAERHYLGLVRGIARDVHTLEDAMGIGDLIARITMLARDRHAQSAAAE